MPFAKARQFSTVGMYRDEEISSYVVARMLQAICGRNDEQQQEQTSPNHVQRNFLSSVECGIQRWSALHEGEKGWSKGSCSKGGFVNLIQGWSKISKRTSFMDHVALTVASRSVHELERKRGIAKSYFNTYEAGVIKSETGVIFLQPLGARSCYHVSY